MPSPQLSPIHWCLSGTSTSTPLRSTAIQCFPLSKPSTICRKLSPSPPEVPSHRNPPLTTFTLLTLYLSLTLSFLPSLHVTTLVFFSPSPMSSLRLPLRAAGKCGYTSKPTLKQPTMNSPPTISMNLILLTLPGEAGTATSRL